MELLCPECGVPISPMEGGRAICSSHGAFRVLYSNESSAVTDLPFPEGTNALDGIIPTPAAAAPKRPSPLAAAWDPAPPSGARAAITAVPSPSVTRAAVPAPVTTDEVGMPESSGGPETLPPIHAHVPDGNCRRHPTVPAANTCCDCSATYCKMCSVRMPYGNQRCPDCFKKKNAVAAQLAKIRRTTGVVPAPGQQQLSNRTCVNHALKPAVCACAFCGTHVCDTCEFPQEDGTHLCPACASRSVESVSSKRITLIAASYIFTVLSVFVLTKLQTSGGTLTQGEAMLLGIVSFVSSAAALASGFSAIDRRLYIPSYAWVGAGLGLATFGYHAILTFYFMTQR